MNTHLIIITALCGLLVASEMNNGAIRLSFTSDQAAAAANRVPPSSVDLLQRKVFTASPGELNLRDNVKIVPVKAYGNLDNSDGGQRMLAGCNHPGCKRLNSESKSEKVKLNGSSSGGVLESDGRVGRPSRMDLGDDEQSRKFEQCKQMLLNLPPINPDPYNRPSVYSMKLKSGALSRPAADSLAPAEPGDVDAQHGFTHTDELLQSQMHKYKLSLKSILKDLGVVCTNGTKLKGTTGVNLHIHLPYPACRQTRSSGGGGGGRGEVARALVGEAGLTLTYRTVSMLNPRGQRSPTASNRGDSDLEITLLNDSFVVPLNHTRLLLNRNNNVRPMKPSGQVRPTAERQPLNVDEIQINGLLESLGNVIQSASFIEQGEMNLADDRTWAQVNNGSGHSHWGH